MQKKNDPIKDLIEKSGNNFHYQVVDFLREKGWFVLVSPYYNDNITDKPREIDIIAEKHFDVRDHMPPSHPFGTLHIRFFIECKYINRPIAFWFDKKDKDKAIKRITDDTPLEPPNKNGLIEQHHYLVNEEVAKLFSSTPDKQPDNEIIYKAINQGLNALVYYRDTDSILPQKDRFIKIIRIINYPLILCNNFDSIYRVDKAASNGYVKIDENFQLEVNYAYLDTNKKSRDEYFLIDVVELSKFDAFLKKLEEADIRSIKTILHGI